MFQGEENKMAEKEYSKKKTVDILSKLYDLQFQEAPILKL